MSITKEEIADYTKKYGKDEKDTGNSKVQIAVLSHRIKTLTAHLKDNHKDQHTKRGLIRLVNKRKALMKYLRKSDKSSFDTVVKELQLRA